MCLPRPLVPPLARSSHPDSAPGAKGRLFPRRHPVSEEFHESYTPADADGAASTIDALVPIAITGLGASGTYNFADVVLTGDTSSLQSNKTMFWVQAGASGAGTRSDPGSLAAAEASGAEVIILLDTQIAGQDLIDGASAGGGLSMVANQSLLGFLNGDTLSIGGGAPANVVLFGVTAGVATNPYAGSGAPLLTTSQAGATTVNLASGALIDGVQIGNLDWKGVYGGYLTAVTIRNSVIHGQTSAISISDNGVAADLALSNLDLSAGSSNALWLWGNSGGQLTVTQLAGVRIAGGGSGGGIYANTVHFDANLGTAGIQPVVASVSIGSSASRVAGAGRVGDASEIAPLALFLTSSESSMCTGAELPFNRFGGTYSWRVGDPSSASVWGCRGW